MLYGQSRSSQPCSVCQHRCCVTVPYYINSVKNPRGKKTLWLYFDSGPRRGLGERRPCGSSLTPWRDMPLFSLKGTESMHTSNRWQKSDKNVLLDLDLWPLDLKTHIWEVKKLCATFPNERNWKHAHKQKMTKVGQKCFIWPWPLTFWPRNLMGHTPSNICAKLGGAPLHRNGEKCKNVKFWTKIVLFDLDLWPFDLETLAHDVPYNH